MKLKLYAYLVVGALASATHAVAAPMFTPFLSVDVNGANYGGGQSVGPTQAGFESLNAFEGFDQLNPAYNPAEDWGNNGGPPTGLTKTFATSEGNITANLIGVPTDQSNRGARNRGANMGGLPDLYQDFAFAQRNGAVAQHGRNFVKLVLSGLNPNQTYEVTLFAREPAFQTDDMGGTPGSGPPMVGDYIRASYQAWTDLATLGGLDGPAAWLDANVSVGASYNPIWESIDHDMDPMTPNVETNTGYKNPIPTLARTLVSGPDSESAANPYIHSASLLSTADAGGIITVYGWSDPNSFGSNVQGASLLNGFQLGVIPEPTSLAIFIVGMVGIAGLRRRFQ